MSSFGIYIVETLDANGKNAAWLAERIGVKPQTVSSWKRKPDRLPKPGLAYKVAAIFEKEFGIPHDRTAEAAGYPFHFSADQTEQQQRIQALAAASPRAASNFARIARLPSDDQDEVLSMIETWMSTRVRRNNRGSAPRRKHPQGSK